ncbi:MAG: hypothetical protein V3W43_04235 [Desulfatiglandaceae bacterium]
MTKNSPVIIAGSRFWQEKRVLVRYSGTQNLCRVMVEGPTEELTLKYCNQVVKAVKEALG